jgi:uncharacterized protein involved in cysteine biosynthesis
LWLINLVLAFILALLITWLANLLGGPQGHRNALSNQAVINVYTRRA